MEYRDEHIKNLMWANEHWTELVEDYREELVAIYDHKVVAPGTSIEEVEEEATKQTGKPKEEITVDFVDSPTTIYAGSTIF